MTETKLHAVLLTIAHLRLHLDDLEEMAKKTYNQGYEDALEGQIRDTGEDGE